MTKLAAMYPLCYFQNRIGPLSEAGIALNDLAVLRGYGTFDFLRTYGLKLFLPERYIQRFFQSAAGLGLQLPVTQAQLHQIILQLLEANRITQDVGVRMVLTGGPSEDSITSREPQLFVLVESLTPKPDELYRKGTKVITVEYQRPLPR